LPKFTSQNTKYFIEVLLLFRLYTKNIRFYTYKSTKSNCFVRLLYDLAITNKIFDQFSNWLDIRKKSNIQ